MDKNSNLPGGFSALISGDWSQRVAFVVDMVREISKQTDPQKLVQAYGARMRQIIQSDGSMSLSRRDLAFPYYRITRSSQWQDAPNPWKSRDKLPLLKGGLLSELIYGEQPVVIDDLKVSDDDPAVEYLRGFRSLNAMPLFDQGHALNMVVLMRKERASFNRDLVPEHLWLSNLFGRMTSNLVLSDQLRVAYETVDHELKTVADIQRSLLPTSVPKIPTLDLAVHYQTSQRAGGDYYDFFELPGGKWGMLIADVSGHGTPAAVIMAVTHSIAHTLHDEPDPPSRLMDFVNQNLTARYTNGNGTFVTAFYGIYDPATHVLTYSNAGHNPPRCVRGGKVISFNGSDNLPLGIEPDERYNDHTFRFDSEDLAVFYTDGITEARAPGGEMYGLERLDETISQKRKCSRDVLQHMLGTVEQFTGGAAPSDDRTLLVAKVS